MRKGELLNFREYEKECKKIRSDNEEYLGIFQSELINKDLSERTIRSHLNNVDFYINTFLLREESIPMNQGCWYVDMFLGDFFIRKCMWSTPSSIKSTASSLKKFYKCMLEHNKVEKEDYTVFTEIIKDNMEEWLDDCRQYNDPNQDNPFYPF